MIRRIVALVALAVAIGQASIARAGDDFDPREANRALRVAMVQLNSVPAPAIVLVTMGVGSLIWERHGHIALCVRDNDPRKNVCYNYGIADFAAPLSMTVGFFRGSHSFWVGKMDAEQMLWTYIAGDRTVWIQPLPLDAAQRDAVLKKLDSDILEDNKYYAYDHFDDNCTTRIRDIIDNVTGHALSKMPADTDGRTFRDLAREGFYGMRMPLLITDIAMGRSTDRVPTYYERMFLPQYLREAVAKQFKVEPLAIYERHGAPPLPDGPSGRVIFAFVVMLFCAPALIARWRRRFERTGLAIAIVPYALLGLVLWVLALISPLPYVRWNESVLVFLPSDLFLLYGVGGARRVMLYARARVAMLGLIALLLIVDVLHQPLWAPLLWPLIPNAIIGFWPRSAAKTSAAEDDAEGEEEAAVGGGGGRRRRARAAARR
jgi:hypothetical protein